MKSIKAWVVLFLIVIFTGSAGAGEKSELAIEKGKMSFSDGDYKRAGELFSEVLSEEPDNFEALHYKGLCEMALGNAPEAVRYLRGAVEQNPEASGARLDLAWAEIETGQPDRALEQIEPVLAGDPEDIRAQYLKGLALLSKKQFSEAREAFAAVCGKESDLAQESCFYKGVCEEGLEKYDDAEVSFTKAKSINPASDIGLASSDHINALQGRAPVERKLFKARINVQYQFDSNIVPIAEEDYLPEFVTEQEDTRFVIFAEGFVRPLRTQRWEGGFGYAFYDSMHQNEDMFNLMVHAGNAYIRRNLTGAGIPLTAHLGYVYQEAGLGEDYNYYSTTHRVPIAFYLQETTWTLTEISGYYEDEAFKDPVMTGFFGEDTESTEDVDIEELDRDNVATALVLAQHFLFFNNRVAVRAGGKYITEDARGDDYDLVRTGAIAELGLIDWRKLSGRLGVDYESRNYMYHTADRDEEIIYLSARMEYSLLSYLSIFLDGSFADYRSNMDTYDYERTIYGVGISGSY